MGRRDRIVGYDDRNKLANLESQIVLIRGNIVKKDTLTLLHDVQIEYYCKTSKCNRVIYLDHIHIRGGIDHPHKVKYDGNREYVRYNHNTGEYEYPRSYPTIGKVYKYTRSSGSTSYSVDSIVSSSKYTEEIARVEEGRRLRLEKERLEEEQRKARRTELEEQGKEFSNFAKEYYLPSDRIWSNEDDNNFLKDISDKDLEQLAAVNFDIDTMIAKYDAAVEEYKRRNPKAPSYSIPFDATTPISSDTYRKIRIVQQRREEKLDAEIDAERRAIEQRKKYQEKQAREKEWRKQQRRKEIIKWVCWAGFMLALLTYYGIAANQTSTKNNNQETNSISR